MLRAWAFGCEGGSSRALPDALELGLLLPVVRSSGLSSAYALERSSRQVYNALTKLLEPIKASFMRLYICGGGQVEHGATVERMDLRRRLDEPGVPGGWEQLTPLPQQRADATCCVLQGFLYVCGGQDGSSVLSSANRFHPSTLDWELLPSMAEGRREAAGAAMRGCVYICGGANTSVELSCCLSFNI